jgi:N utilization substance protein B
MWRRRGRELALMILYGIDVSQTDPIVAYERYFAAFGSDDNLDPPPPYTPPEERPPPVEIDPEAREYARALVQGVAGHKDELDARIRKVSAHWRLERMAIVDRNLLRLGAFEMIHMTKEVPRKVVINEAVEIAKAFSTAESSAFINGILDRIQPAPA